MIEYVLAAEFDIDKGSSLSFQYPRPCGINQNELAELMLPEGSHLHEEDFNVFILNQRPVYAINESKQIEADAKAKYLKMGGTVFVFDRTREWRPANKAADILEVYGNELIVGSDEDGDKLQV